MKVQIMDWEKILATHISDKKIVSRMYKVTHNSRVEG